MPIPVPNLDDLTWSDFVDRGRALIPAYAPDWTDHNASDPGITLVEMFAYVADMLLFRIDQVSDEHIEAFLKLVNGPKWKPGALLEESVRATVARLREPARAVTTQDYEQIAGAVPGVLKAICVPGRNLSGQSRHRMADAPGHVSVIVMVSPEAAEDPLPVVAARIERARMVGTRTHVTRVRVVDLTLSVDIVPEHGEKPDVVLQRAIEEVNDFFNPVDSPGHKGYPIGRDVYVSEIYQLLERIPGVDFVQRVVESRGGGTLDEIQVNADEAWRLRKNENDELEAVSVLADEIVRFRMRAQRKRS